ncbi:hypothetical protein C3L33_08203, partial [Rhododendron williamsianum]
MHDLVHDLAQNVTGDFCYRLEDGMLNGISEKVRHFSYVRGKFDGFDKLKVIKDAKCLRTFLPIGSRTSGKQWLSKKVLDEILSGLTRLRFLSLARYQIVELPYSIGNLIHLRFLDLSDTLISELPPSVCTLHNLETLLLSNCQLLTTLPSELVKLILLRRLDLSGTNLKEMPMQMSRLKDLQELTTFVVGNCNGSGINELKDLDLLRGTISISGLQNLIGDLPKGHSLVRLKIKECPELVASLPRITSMRELVLQECQGLLLEWQGISSLEIVKISSFASNFASELLTLTNLKQLKVSWCPKLVFPLYCYTSLERLSFSECESLKSLPLGLFPKLRSLEINSCVNFENLLLPNEIELQNLPLLETLYIRFCDNMVSFPGRGLPAPNLSDLWVCYCKKLKALPEQMRTLLPSLQRLIVWICPEIESFPEGGLPYKLHVLWIWNCKKLVGNRRDWGLQTLPYLSTFTLEGESEDVLESFPEEGLLPSTLTKLEIGDLKNLKSLNKRGLELLDSLEAMEIRNCPQLKSLPDEGLPTTLSELLIEDCPSLKSRCRREEGEDWYKVAHIPGIIMDDEVIFDHKYPGPPESAGPSVSFSEAMGAAFLHYCLVFDFLSLKFSQLITPRGVYRSLALAVVNERPTTYHNNNKVDAALTPCTMNDDVIFLGMNMEEIFSRRDLSPLPEVNWTLPPRYDEHMDDGFLITTKCDFDNMVNSKDLKFFREDEFYGLKGAKVGVVEVVKAAAICSPFVLLTADCYLQTTTL